MFGSFAVVGVYEDAIRTECLEKMGDVGVIVAEVGQDEARAMPADVNGQGSSDAIGRWGDVLATVDVSLDGATALT